MTQRHQYLRARARLERAREFYAMKQPWARNIAWTILTELATATPGHYSAVEIHIASAVEEGDMKTAFRILGQAAKDSIADLKYISTRKYTQD